jgi:MFS family permease
MSVAATDSDPTAGAATTTTTAAAGTDTDTTSSVTITTHQHRQRQRERQRRTPEEKARSHASRVAIRPVAFILCLHIMAFATASPALGDLTLHFFDDDSSQASLYLGVVTACVSLLSFFSQPIYGVISDHYGRKPFLALGVCGVLTWAVLTALFLNVESFSLGALIAGATTAVSASISASVVDLSPSSSDFSRNFGYVGAALAIGTVVGAGTGAGLLELGLRAPFIAASGIQTLNLIFIVFFFKETISTETFFQVQSLILAESDTATTGTTAGGSGGSSGGATTGPGGDSTGNDTTHVNAHAHAHAHSHAHSHGIASSTKQIRKADLLAHSANPCKTLKILLTSTRLKLLAAAQFCMTISLGVVFVFLVYTEEVFGWNGQESAGFVLYFFFIFIFAQLLLVKRLIHRWGDNNALRYSAINVIGMLVLFGIAWEGWMWYVLATLSPIAMVFPPIVSGEMSREVNTEMQGKLQGGAASLNVIGNIFGSLTAAGLFSYFVSDHAFVYLPGAPFFFGAIFAILALLFVVKASHHPVAVHATHIDTAVIHVESDNDNDDVDDVDDDNDDHGHDVLLMNETHETLEMETI